MLICSGILTSLITFLNSFFSSPSGFPFFSLSLALLTEAKLLCLISISSTFKALETVNLKFLLSTDVLSFNLLLEAVLSSFFMKSFVACCSTNFLAKFLFLLLWYCQNYLVYYFYLKGCFA